MLALQHYTDREVKALLSSLAVLVDTREQANAHLLYYFKEQDIAIKEKALSYGDYSFNLTKERSRFENELIKAQGAGCRLFLLVEGGSWEDIVEGNYKSQYNSKSFLATLISFSHRYNLHVLFCEKSLSGKMMLNIFHYFLREYLK